MDNLVYDIDCNVDESTCPFEDCQTQNMNLYSHENLSQDYIYTQSFTSRVFEGGRQYVALLGKGKNKNERGEITDILYIWEINENIYKHKFNYKDKRIHGVEYSPKGDSFVIVYDDHEPCYYSLKSGKRIKKFESVNLSNEGNILTYQFSPNGGFFGIAFQSSFVVWKTTGNDKKCLVKFEDRGHLKFFRGKTLVSISKSDTVRVLSVDGKVGEDKMWPLEDIAWDDIINGMISPDGTKLYIATCEEICVLNLETGDFETGYYKFETSDIKKVLFSSDCNQVACTNLRNIYFYKLDQNENLGTVLKENFRHFEVLFESNTLVTLDDICINFTDYGNENEDERFIYFEKNNDHFESFTFSPDFEYLLAITGEHSATIYETTKGRVVKKWKNDCERWSECCLMAPEKSDTAIIATKSSPQEVKIWNYRNGNDILALPDYDVASFCFDETGGILAAGTKGTNEIARVWDLKSGDYNSYNWPSGLNNNRNTKVLLTKRITDDEEKEDILIAVSELQYPIVFKMENSQMLYQCTDAPITLSHIDEIESNPDADVFLLKGTDGKGISHGLLFKLSDGKFLRLFQNCINVTLSKEKKMLLARCNNLNGGKLCVLDLSDLDSQNVVDCGIDADVSSFIQGSEAIASSFGDERETKYTLNNPFTGKMFGYLNIEKKNDNYCEMDISANDKILIFRYIQLHKEEFTKDQEISSSMPGENYQGDLPQQLKNQEEEYQPHTPEQKNLVADDDDLGGYQGGNNQEEDRPSQKGPVAQSNVVGDDDDLGGYQGGNKQEEDRPSQKGPVAQSNVVGEDDDLGGFQGGNKQEEDRPSQKGPVAQSNLVPEENNGRFLKEESKEIDDNNFGNNYYN